MFSKKSKKKKDGQGNFRSGSIKAALPRTIYFMNINELRQTALLHLPKRSGPIEEGKQDESQSVSISCDVEEEDGCSDSESKITRDGAEQTSLKFSEENSLDELFLQNSARKPPPKICRKSKGRSSECFSDSLEMDQCTLLSSGPSPVKRSRGGNEGDDSKFSILKYSLSSPMSTDAVCGNDIAGGSRASMTIESSVSEHKPDLSFLDDIF